MVVLLSRFLREFEYVHLMVLCTNICNLQCNGPVTPADALPPTSPTDLSALATTVPLSYSQVGAHSATVMQQFSSLQREQQLIVNSYVQNCFLL